jgi:hypothetical protein
MGGGFFRLFCVAIGVSFCYACDPFALPHRLDSTPTKMQELRENKTCCAMYVTIILAVIASAVGCQQLRETWSLPFVGEPPAYKQAYGPTPRQRIEALQQLAGRSANLTPQELLTTGAELTETFKNERDPHIRRAIVQTLAALPGNFADEALLEALQDPVASVRCAACEAWATRSDANQALAVLHERVTTDQDPDVRLTAVQAMSRLELPESVQYLASALDHRDPAMRITAIESLQKVSGENFGSDLNAWRQFAARQRVNPGSPQRSIVPPAVTSVPPVVAGAPPSTVQTASGYAPATSAADDGDFVR